KLVSDCTYDRCTAATATMTQRALGPALREAIAHSLTRRGHHVTIAVDAVQGLERLQGAVFDVVITDLQGRQRGGLWLWRKALEARPELTGRFVLIASEARPEAHDMTLFIDRER